MSSKVRTEWVLNQFVSIFVFTHIAEQSLELFSFDFHLYYLLFFTYRLGSITLGYMLLFHISLFLSRSKFFFTTTSVAQQ